MIVGHAMGLPVEETVLQLAPAGAAIATAAAIGARAALARLRRRLSAPAVRPRTRAGQGRLG
ncbi:MAG TPA: hypothetical protein VFB42_12075 [Gaiellaceae bacterium]|nr:hypothetical protein [Gaiellaceae bacterium]